MEQCYFCCYSQLNCLLMKSVTCDLPLQPQSDLLELIQVMIVVFGEEPPVFSRPTASSSYPPYQATGPPTSKWSWLLISANTEILQSVLLLCIFCQQIMYPTPMPTLLGCIVFF